MAEIIYQVLGISAIVSAILIFIGKSLIKSTIKSSVQHGFNLLLEKKKIELDIERTKKWELKREASLKALDLVNAVFSHRFEHESKGAKMVLAKVDTNEVRKCVNELACSIDNPEILTTFKNLMGLKDSSADQIVDFRNMIREELEFGKPLDEDREFAFFIRIPGDES